jgi:hypothetical protein
MARLGPPSITKFALLAVVVAVLATVGFVHEVIKKSWTTSPLPTAQAQPPSRPAATQTSSPTGPDASDDRGFLNSSARCDGPLSAVAIARTKSSLVAICTDQKGGYFYHGVRLSDGAALDVPAESTGGREFVARSGEVAYSLSTQQFVVTAGDTVVRSEPVIEYREPHSFAAEAPPGQGSVSAVPSTQRPAG